MYSAKWCILFYFICAANFKVLLISACTYLGVARAEKFNQNYHNHNLN